jgi:hypothetical protein
MASGFDDPRQLIRSVIDVFRGTPSGQPEPEGEEEDLGEDSDMNQSTHPVRSTIG